MKRTVKRGLDFTGSHFVYSQIAVPTVDADEAAIIVGHTELRKAPQRAGMIDSGVWNARRGVFTITSQPRLKAEASSPSGVD